jgi:hypothetical protein
MAESFGIKVDTSAVEASLGKAADAAGKAESKVNDAAAAVDNAGTAAAKSAAQLGGLTDDLLAAAAGVDGLVSAVGGLNGDLQTSAAAINQTGDAIEQVDGASSKLADALLNVVDATAQADAAMSQAAGTAGTLADKTTAIVDASQTSSKALDELGQSAAEAEDDFTGLIAMLNEFVQRKGKELGQPVKIFSADDAELLKVLRTEFQGLVADTKSLPNGIGNQLKSQPKVTSPEQINGPMIERDAKKLQLIIDRMLANTINRTQRHYPTSITGLTSNEINNPGGQPQDPNQPNPAGKPKEPIEPKHKDTLFGKIAQTLGFAARQIAPLAGGAGQAVAQAGSMGAEGAAGRGMGGMLAGGGMAGAAAGAGIGMLAFGAYKAASAVNEGVDREKVLNTDIDKLKRSLGSTSDSFNDLAVQSRLIADTFNLTNEVSRKLSTEFINIAKTNVNAIDQAKVGVGLAQATGVDEQRGVSMVASLRRDGAMGSTKEDASRFAAQFAEALKRTGSTLNAGELMNAIQGFSSETARRSLTAPNTEGYAGLLSALVGSKTPGMTVENAAGMLDKFDKSFQGGGSMGQASSNFQFMALKGNDVGALGVAMREAAGYAATADQTFGGKDNAVNKWLTDGGEKPMSQFGGNKMAIEEIVSTITENIPSRRGQIEAMMGAYHYTPNEAATMLSYNQKGKEGKEGKLHGIGDLVKQYDNLNINNLSGTGMLSMADISHAKGQMDGENGLVSVRDNMLKRTDLTKDQKEQLKATSGMSGQKDSVAMQLALVNIANTMEREKTTGEKIAADAAKTANRIDDIAKGLIPASTLTNSLLADLVTWMAPKSEGAKRIEAEKIEGGMLKERDLYESGKKSEKQIRTRNTAYQENDAHLRSQRASRDEIQANSVRQIQELGSTAVMSKGSNVGDWELAKKEAESRTLQYRAAHGGIVGEPSDGRTDPTVKKPVTLKTSTTPAQPPDATDRAAQAVSTGGGKPAKRGQPGEDEMARYETHAKDIAEAEKAHGLQPGELAGLMSHENKFKSDGFGKGVNAKGEEYSTSAFGMGQMLVGAVKDATPEFEKIYGRKPKMEKRTYTDSKGVEKTVDVPTDPKDQIRLSAIYKAERNRKGGSVEEGNKRWFAGDGGVDGSGVVSKPQISDFNADVSRRQGIFAKKSQTPQPPASIVPAVATAPAAVPVATAPNPAPASIVPAVATAAATATKAPRPIRDEFRVIPGVDRETLGLGDGESPESSKVAPKPAPTQQDAAVAAPVPTADKSAAGMLKNPSTPDDKSQTKESANPVSMTQDVLKRAMGGDAGKVKTIDNAARKMPPAVPVAQPQGRPLEKQAASALSASMAMQRMAVSFNPLSSTVDVNLRYPDNRIETASARGVTKARASGAYA